MSDAINYKAARAAAAASGLSINYNKIHKIVDAALEGMVLYVRERPIPGKVYTAGNEHVRVFPKAPA